MNLDDELNEEVNSGIFEKTGENEFGLVLPFDSDHPEFTRGFACGQAWQLIEMGEPYIEMMITSDNLYMFITMADAKGYRIEGEETGKEASNLLDTEWIRVCLTKIES